MKNNFLKKIVKLITPFFIKNLYVSYVFSLKEKKYSFHYNLLSKLFYNSVNKVSYNNNRYFLTEKDGEKWSFTHTDRGLFYLKGIKSRGKILHRDYGIDAIDFKDGDVVIDCGADTGDLYAGFDKKIKYYGFEPSPINFPNLKFNVRNQQAYDYALWKNSNHDIKFYESDISKKKSATNVPGATRAINVKTKTLDEIIDDIRENIKLIKLEGTGSEPEILEGLKNNINKVEFITVDASFERGVNKDHTINECVNYLVENNFKLVDFRFTKICLLFKNNFYK